MGLVHIFSLFCLLNFCGWASPFATAIASPRQSSLEIYIVHVEKPESETQLPTSSSSILKSKDVLDSWYQSFLPIGIESSNEEQRMVYPYYNVLTGFAAKLTAEEVKEMEKKPGFLSAQPQKVLSLHTTHSPSFLGLHQNTGFWNESKYGKGVIIGVVDTGITPGHPSFDDGGMPPPPPRWKGKCEFNTSICNNKLIGARSFSQGNQDASPVDDVGHGTHTASTAAGNFVKGANVYGSAYGTAVGVAPLAHLAIYKVCHPNCFESDTLAAMDAAIDDGVDILSISLGSRSIPFYLDNIALGAYSTIQKGIFVSCAAGNDGPFSSTASNEAPWILTVGASSIDRKLKVTIMLGNNEQLDGEAGHQPKDFPSTYLPLSKFPGQNQIKGDQGNEYCLAKRSDMKGKIVVCEIGKTRKKLQNIKANDGVGMLVANVERYGYTIPATVQDFPTIHISYADRLKLINYINSTSSPIVAISFKGTSIGDNRAPAVACFSSRGPSLASPGILKPDVIGPGLNILAAWNANLENNKNTRFNFNIISGTSMACPHLSGVAALLKSAHPTWSPAAIKSAIMTTADAVNLAEHPIEDERRIPADLFATGSGHVNPTRASDPGLIYDLEPEEYIPYLCGLNYTDDQVSVIAKRKVYCKKESSITEAQLNYPSLSIVLGYEVQSYTRTVTNVGVARSIYNAEIVPPPGVDVIVKPDTLSFSEVNQKLTYEVTFRKSTASASNVAVPQGSITWTSSKYTVRSPIAAILV